MIGISLDSFVPNINDYSTILGTNIFITARLFLLVMISLFWLKVNGYNDDKDSRLTQLIRTSHVNLKLYFIMITLYAFTNFRIKCSLNSKGCDIFRVFETRRRASPCRTFQ